MAMAHDALHSRQKANETFHDGLNIKIEESHFGAAQGKIRQKMLQKNGTFL